MGFVPTKGNTWVPRKDQNAYKRIIEKAGIPHMWFHNLRQTAATIMLANGNDLPTFSRRLGHTRASAKLDIYAHMVSGSQEKAAESWMKSLLQSPIQLNRSPRKTWLHRSCTTNQTPMKIARNKFTPISEN